MAAPGWEALLPTLSVLTVALLLRSTIPALVTGIVVGHLVLDGPGTVGSFADSLIERLQNRSEAWALAVCGVFGVLIRLLVVTGGAAAFGRLVGGRIRSGRAALLVAWVLGIVVFIDDYLNALILGRTLRPISDMHRVPRERLAYVIDSTAAPVCLLVPISTWAIYVAGLLETVGSAEPGTGMAAYLRIIPFAFYGWFAVLLVPLVVTGLIPAWGAMRRADERVAAGGSLAPPGSPPADEPPDEATAASGRLADFVFPLVTLVAATVLSGNDALQGGLWAIGMVAVQQLLWRRRFSVASLTQAGCQGLADMVPVLVTLLLAFMLGHVNERLHLAEFAIGALGPWLDHRLLPAAAFVCLSGVAFATGSFWGTYAIALPIVIPLAASMGADPTLSIAAVVSAGGFGSHACFFGDTTVMTSQASGCDNLAHAWSQLPYAMVAAALTVAAFLVAGLLSAAASPEALEAPGKKPYATTFANLPRQPTEPAPPAMPASSAAAQPAAADTPPDPWFQDRFAQRIGGANFAKGSGIYKFELIKRAKRQALADHPERRMLDFGIGENDELAPEGVRAVMRREIDRPENRGYADNGIAAFKEAAAAFMQREFGVALDPVKEVNHCIGSKTAYAMLPAAFIDPGDVTLMTVPGYPVAGTATKWFGGTVHPLPLVPEHGFLPDLESIPADVLARTKLLVLCYPNSPTGRTATRAFYEKVVDWAHRHRVIVIQDAAHIMLSYDDRPLSFLSIDGAKEVGLEVHSMSKGFHMIGWRMGWVCGHERLVRAFADVKDNCDSGQFMAIQKAAAAALADPEIPRRVREKYRRRLEKLVGVLRAVGFDCEMPGGTYFLYTKSPTGAGDRVFATAQEASQFLIHELSISTVPWDDCGAYLRFSATYEAEDESAEDDLMAEAHARLARARLKFS